MCGGEWVEGVGRRRTVCAEGVRMWEVCLHRRMYVCVCKYVCVCIQVTASLPSCLTFFLFKYLYKQ